MDLFFGVPDTELALSEKEKKILKGFNNEMSAVQAKRMAFLRDAARKHGFSASELKGLKSTTGKSFIEEDATRSSRDYRMAVVRKGKLNAVVETAYFCKGMFSDDDDPNTCGWVKGRPSPEKYDEIGPLAGSRGTRYFCKICGQLIGEFRAFVS